MSKQIRNIAIIAHVDHGKTTMVDQLLRQSGTFADHEKVVGDTVMDNNAIEPRAGYHHPGQELCRGAGRVPTSTSSTPLVTQTLAAKWSALCPWLMALCC